MITHWPQTGPACCRPGSTCTRSARRCRSAPSRSPPRCFPSKRSAERQEAAILREAPAAAWQGGSGLVPWTRLGVVAGGLGEGGAGAVPLLRQPHVNGVGAGGRSTGAVQVLAQPRVGVLQAWRANARQAEEPAGALARGVGEAQTRATKAAAAIQRSAPRCSKMASTHLEHAALGPALRALGQAGSPGQWRGATPGACGVHGIQRLLGVLQWRGQGPGSVMWWVHAGCSSSSSGNSSPRTDSTGQEPLLVLGMTGDVVGVVG